MSDHSDHTALTCFGGILNVACLSVLVFACAEVNDTDNEVQVDSKIAALVNHGLSHYKSSPSLAVEEANEAISLTNPRHPTIERANAFRLLALARQQLSEYTLANAAFDSALIISKSIKDEVLQSTVHYEKGLNYHAVGEMTNALESLGAALQLAETTHGQEVIAEVLNAIGMVYHSQNNFNQAFAMYTRSLPIARAAGDSALSAQVLNNIALVYKDRGEYDSAIYLGRQSVRIREQLVDLAGAASGYFTLAIISKSRGWYDSALYYIDQAVHRKVQVYDYSGQAACLVVRAEIEIKRKRLNEAYQDLLAASAILKEHDSKRQRRALYRGFYNYYYTLENYPEAIRWKDRYHWLNDSLFNEAKTRQFAEMQTLFEVGEKQKQIARLELEQSRAMFRSRFLMLLLAASIFVALALVFWFTDRMKQRKKAFLAQAELDKAKIINARLVEDELRNELNHKNRELATHAIHFIQRSQLMDELKSEISNLEGETDEGLRDKLRQMSRVIDNRFDIEQGWDDFKVYFEQVHPGFFEALLNHSPDLSGSELKLCVLLKLNMNIKESARILGISPDSAKTARYRLRKKLGLMKEDSLTTFVLGLSSSTLRASQPATV